MQLAQQTVRGLLAHLLARSAMCAQLLEKERDIGRQALIEHALRLLQTHRPSALGRQFRAAYRYALSSA